MPFPCKGVVRTWLFITIISLTAVKVFGSSGEKKIDLRIGFDLTQGVDGAPSLRIRDFEDLEDKRAKDDDMETKPTVRADSFSDSDEIGAHNAPKHDITSKESSGEKSSDDDDDYSGENAKLSTRGLNAADYEPAEAVRSHPKDNGSSDDTDRLRRRKRSALLRRKGNKDKLRWIQ